MICTIVYGLGLGLEHEHGTYIWSARLQRIHQRMERASNEWTPITTMRGLTASTTFRMSEAGEGSDIWLILRVSYANQIDLSLPVSLTYG